MQTMKTASTAIATELCQNYAGEMILHKHATYSQFLSQASKEEQTYFSFAGVRNPLDVAVSRYELRKLTPGPAADRANRVQNDFILSSGANFAEFFAEFMVKRGVDFATVPLTWRSKSFQAIDYIYKYENLQQEFSTILARAGIEQKRPLPLINRTRGKDHYLQYYDEPTLQMACALCQDYLRRWGYEVPEHAPLKLSPAQRVGYYRNRLESRFGETPLWSVLRQLKHLMQ